MQAPEAQQPRVVYTEMAAIIKCSSRHAEVFRYTNYHFSGAQGHFKGERVEDSARISIENRIMKWNIGQNETTSMPDSQLHSFTESTLN